MTLNQMRYVLEQMSYGEEEDQQVCLYLANGTSLTGEACLVEDDKGAGIVQIEGGSAGVVAFVEVGAIAAVRLVVSDKCEAQAEKELSDVRNEV